MSVNRRRASLFACACAALAVVALARPAVAAPNIGIVLDVSGEWVLVENGRPAGRIERGQAVTSGSVVRPGPDARGGHVVIHLNNDRVVRCEVGNLGDCRRPLALARRTGAAGRFWASVAYLVTRQPGLYVPAFTRGEERGGAGELRESVVKLDGATIDLGPAFGGMSAGRYNVRLDPSKPGGARRKFAPVVVDWKPGRPAPVAFDGLTPGLYRVLIFDPESGEPATDAWVLVAGASEFREASAKLRQASEWSRGWSAGAGRDAGRTFLRAYLDSLTRAGRK